MELKEFVSQTLIQIIEGVKFAQSHAENNDSMIAPGGVTPDRNFGWNGQDVEFDVAITTSDTVEGKAGAGIFVAAFTFGGQVKGETYNQSISRIKFSIPVYLPPQQAVTVSHIRQKRLNSKKIP